MPTVACSYAPASGYLLPVKSYAEGLVLSCARLCLALIAHASEWFEAEAQYVPRLSPTDVNGNSTARLANCSSYPAPPTAFLDSSFLGDRQFIVAGNVNFSYFQFGPTIRKATGKPLIMVAGLGETSSAWNPDLLQTLAAGNGMPTDFNSSEASTVLWYASSTVALVQALGLKKPDILGFSFGGFVVLTAVIHFPNMVNHVVLADTSAGGAVGLSNLTRTYGQYFATLPFGSPESTTLFNPDSAAGNAGLCRNQAFQAIVPNDTDTSAQAAPENTVTQKYLGDPTSAVFHALANITSHVLVFGGVLDVRISVQDVYTIANEIPSASLILFPDAGHAAIRQYGVTAGTIISAFLDEQSVIE